MTTTTQPILTKTFTAALHYEGSWGSRDAGTHDSTMALHLHTDDTGRIEWEIPSLDEYVEIGLRFEISATGARSLAEYDGTMSLPFQAVELMREAGIAVGNDFDDAAQFVVNGGQPIDYWEFCRVNGDDLAVCEWALHANVGDKFPALVDCRRVA